MKISKAERRSRTINSRIKKRREYDPDYYAKKRIDKKKSILRRKSRNVEE